MAFHTSSLSAIRESIRAREVSITEITRQTIAHIERINPSINAFTQVFAEQALHRAAKLDAIIADNPASPLPLLGIPIAIKDNICLSPADGGDRTTCASRYLETYRSPFSATVAHKLLDAGAIIIGKTNLDEFAMGSSTEHSIFGPTRNPWDLQRVPGGSSGGSAAAVASKLVSGALGSDTGGSIRQPAGWCNLFGLKPTYGRISRYGLVAYASSLDQIGTFARTVTDTALLTSIISGHDPHDSTSAELPAADMLLELDRPIDKLVLGVPAQARSAANDPAVTAALNNAIHHFTHMGGVVVDINLPHAEYGIAAYYIIAPAEASSNLARFDGVRYGRRAALNSATDDLFALYAKSRAEGFGHEVQRRIMLGTHVLSSGYYDAYYTTALKARRLIKRDFDNAFEGLANTPCHAILMPSSPGPAFKFGEHAADPMSMYLEDVYTVGVNLAGLPAITMPGGFAPSARGDLPIGLQLIGPALGESTILRIARMFEQVTDYSSHSAPHT